MPTNLQSRIQLTTEDPNRIAYQIAILGAKGSGKSTLAAEMVQDKYACPRPVIVFDPTNSFHSGIVVSNFRQFWSMLAAGEEILTRGVFIIRHTDPNLVTCFIEFMKVSGGTLVVDESYDLSTQWSTNPALSDVIRKGRHYAEGKGINLICIAQRSTSLHREVTAQASCIVSYWQTHPDDIKQLARYDTRAMEIPKLRFYHAICLGKPPKRLESFFLQYGKIHLDNTKQVV